jgi:hypothetical protein
VIDNRPIEGLSAVEYAVYRKVHAQGVRDWGTRTDDLVEVRLAHLDHADKYLSVHIPEMESVALFDECVRLIGGTAAKELRMFRDRDWYPAVWCENHCLSVNLMG